MPGFLGGSSGSGTGGEIRFPAEFIDPVTKLRVSEPQTLIDTDFEYGLQPTKWESVELINNTPSFFSKGGDTTIPNISSVTTTELSREIKVTTSLAHGLAVGIPINVTGSKSLTADGAYIINSVPDSFTFTYLCKQNQTESASIEDLYTSIVTGEFFQGSQIKIADSDGLVTNGAGNSVLTVTTESPHGFGINTPFYFLNLNSTISQEFDSSNTNSKAFDAANLSTAQTFDGSNSLVSYLVDLDNNAVLGGAVSSVSTVSLVNNTITVAHTSENFVGKAVGTPLYHNVSSASGYFATTPLGVVFLKFLSTSTVNGSIFTVSATPDGTVIPITSSVTGTFQLANEARTFAGNNLDSTTQTTLTILKETAIEFDGGNRGYAGAATNGLSEVLGYTGTTSPFLVSTSAGVGLDYYTNAMVKYDSTGTAATGLTNGRTYFIDSYATTGTANQYRITIKEYPNSVAVLSPTGGTGTQTFNKIGVATDKDIVHIKNSNYAVKDMLQYSFPVGGRFTAASAPETKLFYFVQKAYDAHNYELSEIFSAFVSATGGVTSTLSARGGTYNVHTFANVGTSTFTVTAAGTTGLVEYLIIGGGGGGGGSTAGGGGAGGFLAGTTTVTSQAYSIIVGDGGVGSRSTDNGAPNNANGNNSSAFGLTAIGGGKGYSGGSTNTSTAATAGGSGGGGGAYNPNTAPNVSQGGAGTSGQGNAGGGAVATNAWGGAGGGGAGSAGIASTDNAPNGVNTNFPRRGGEGLPSFITGVGQYYAAGGGGATTDASYSLGGTGGGGRGIPIGGTAGVSNTGSGGGAGGYYQVGNTGGGKGGSGIVIIRYPITDLAPVATVASGGTSTTTLTLGATTYRVHTFSTVGNPNLVVTTAGNLGTADYLIVAGGGAGGSYVGGGGGGGGVIQGTYALAAQTYPVVVGAGGPAVGSTSAQQNTRGNNGSPSSVFGLTAVGGGGGATYPSQAGSAGGSGGGAGGFQDATGAGGTATVNQGFAGGNSIGSRPRSFTGGGGGGGAGAVGEDSSNALNRAGDGGVGTPSAINGTYYLWAGGGGGGNYTDGARPGNGGFGGGGGGAANTTGIGVGGGGALNSGGNSVGIADPGSTAGSGGANTGGGGGGNGHFGLSGAGGSGIVIIRYPIATVGI